eukprot:CAMPEP_0177598368 /NCGR_PEP_ID=MMETSP0419_2-20121207/12303_1 /TAXON_ID=582737 /ORGANISM="Tetraselmis sp., Strain GSL018" /LENGTH=156 /DNA_ID=CAMNT_0019090791 /DNA_START=1360 /DNA_END=1827 /DNA_ORIENTATION=+
MYRAPSQVRDPLADENRVCKRGLSVIDVNKAGVEEAYFPNNVYLTVKLDPVPDVVRVLHEKKQHRLERVSDAVAKDEGQGEHSRGERGESLHKVDVPDDEIQSDEQEMERPRETRLKTVHHAVRVCKGSCNVGPLPEKSEHCINDLLLGDFGLAVW